MLGTDDALFPLASPCRSFVRKSGSGRLLKTESASPCRATSAQVLGLTGGGVGGRLLETDGASLSLVSSPSSHQVAGLFTDDQVPVRPVGGRALKTDNASLRLRGPRQTPKRLPGFMMGVRSLSATAQSDGRVLATGEPAGCWPRAASQAPPSWLSCCGCRGSGAGNGWRWKDCCPQV